MPSVQTPKYDAQGIFKLNSHDQQLTIDDHPVGIRKQSALEEAEEPEPEPGPKVRTVTVLMLTEWLGLPAAVIRVSEDTGWNEQRAAAAEGACWLWGGYGKGEEVFVSPDFSLLQALVHRHLYCRTVDMVIHLTGVQCRGQCCS